MDANNIYERIKNELVENEKTIEDVKLVKNINDYTIRFLKSAVIKIKNGKKDYIYIKAAYKDKFNDHVNLEQVNSMPNWLRFQVFNEKHIEVLLLAVIDMHDDIYSQSIEIFGCCHRFEQCSDELKCINPDTTLARGCMYKLNLEAGLIIYGKNKNVTKPLYP